MKKLLIILISGLLVFNLYAQDFQGNEAEALVHGSKVVRLYSQTNLPAYISFRQGFSIDLNNFKSWMMEQFKMSNDFDFVLISSESDQLGYVHYRYKQTYKGTVLDETMYILHTFDGKVSSMNGLAFSNLTLETQPKVTEQAALATAFSVVSAIRYKWQMPDEEQFLKKQQNDPNATYYPKGELVYMPLGKDFKTSDLRLAYKFNIYADEPVSRAYYYIDAISGLLIQKIDIIHNTDTKGIAYTKYSGTQTIMVDSISPTLYRLSELSRGKGVQTLNLQKTTNYGAAIDFTDSDNIWNNVNANFDEAATDAHWGAEMTYDFYKNIHGRNSVDNNGLALLNYVHYSTNYANAFWDGQRMTFGDGNANNPPFTVLDIIGHEITHGLVSYTANLSSTEGGALNESFADIFGTLIEFYAKPTQANWMMGDNIIPIRNMANPKLMGDPDTYFGLNWDSITNEVHKNSTVQSFWFYLLVNGGIGKNDKGNSFKVNGVGMQEADEITYRSLTVYLTSSADYFDARYYSIQAASDLYGDCSPEVAAVIDAWYAVGVGKDVRSIDFDANMKVFCKTPFTAKFTNNSDAYSSFLWDFGDGTTTTLRSPNHNYTKYGKFSVKLKGITACGVTDSIVKKDFIIVDTNQPCTYLMPANSNPVTNTECHGLLLDDGGYGNYSGNLTSTFSIVTSGTGSIILNFKSFAFEDCTPQSDCDDLYIYDGPNTNSTLIGKYTGFSLPNGGTIISTGPAITFKEVTDPAQTYSGFELEWVCSDPSLPPVSNFIVENESDCNGSVQFLDKSYNGASKWLWIFGDGDTSTIRNPVHSYSKNGYYTVSLTSSNANGSNTVTKQNIAHITFPLQTPEVSDIDTCKPGSFTITIPKTDNSLIEWFDSWKSNRRIDTGYIFKTPYLTQPKDYFVQSSTVTNPVFIQPNDNNAGAGGYYTNSANHYLIFDAYKEFTLKSVKVYSSTSDTRTLELLDSKGTLVKDTLVLIPNGESRISLNFIIPQGNGYKIGVRAPSNLYRNTSGITLPITLPGVLSITGTTAGTSGYYYYLYNWEILESSCKSERVKLSITISQPKADFNYINSNSVYSFVNTTPGSGSNLLWNFGDGTTSKVENPVHQYQKPGQYIVTMIVDNNCGKDSVTKTINIQESIDQPVVKSFLIYPNPTNDLLNIRFEPYQDGITSMIMTNSLGKILIDKKIAVKGTYLGTIDLSAFGKGIYYLQVSNNKGNIVRKIVVN